MRSKENRSDNNLHQNQASTSSNKSGSGSGKVIKDNRPVFLAQKNIQNLADTKSKSSNAIPQKKAIIQRKEGDKINGVIRLRTSDNTLAIWTDEIRPWYNLPANSDVNENDSVSFIEDADRLVTNLKVEKKMRTDIDISKMNSAQLYDTFYNFMILNPPIFKEKYKCSGEDGVKKYSKEYTFHGLDNVILHIHWENTGKKVDVAKAHIKRLDQKYKIGTSTSLSISYLKEIKVPYEKPERLYNKLI